MTVPKRLISRPDPKVTDVVIVGCGPAGMAAAIQLKRAGLEPVVFEKGKVGGLLVNAHLVENYPGFPEGISGVDLVALMRRHLTVLGIEVVFEKVTMVDVEHDRFLVRAGGSDTRSMSLIIASGTRPNMLASVPIPRGLSDRVTYEIDPIRSVRGKAIAIVGAGDAAFDYALSLGKHNDVTILSRGYEPRCLPLLSERAAMSPRISFVPETEVTAIEGADGPRLALGCRNPGGALEIVADHLVIAIGRYPDLGFMSQQSAGTGAIRQGEGFLHLIGDVSHGSMRQTAIAVGDGMVAAMVIAGKLREIGR
ncbi:MAG: NAD(P)/FAD-dependent oxidoreductase [Candidatus Eisenbacteria bacterium]